jgi:hypothetical protein
LWVAGPSVPAMYGPQLFNGTNAEVTGPVLTSALDRITGAKPRRKILS